MITDTLNPVMNEDGIIETAVPNKALVPPTPKVEPLKIEAERPPWEDYGGPSPAAERPPWEDYGALPEQAVTKPPETFLGNVKEQWSRGDQSVELDRQENTSGIRPEIQALQPTEAPPAVPVPNANVFQKVGAAFATGATDLVANKLAAATTIPFVSGAADKWLMKMSRKVEDLVSPETIAIANSVQGTQYEPGGVWATLKQIPRIGFYGLIQNAPQIVDMMVAEQVGKALGVPVGTLIGAVASGGTPAAVGTAPAGAVTGGVVGSKLAGYAAVAMSETGSFRRDADRQLRAQGIDTDDPAVRGALETRAREYGLASGASEYASMLVALKYIPIGKARKAALKSLGNTPIFKIALRPLAGAGVEAGTEGTQGWLQNKLTQKLFKDVSKLTGRELAAPTDQDLMQATVQGGAVGLYMNAIGVPFSLKARSKDGGTVTDKNISGIQAKLGAIIQDQTMAGNMDAATTAGRMLKAAKANKLDVLPESHWAAMQRTIIAAATPKPSQIGGSTVVEPTISPEPIPAPAPPPLPLGTPVNGTPGAEMPGAAPVVPGTPVLAGTAAKGEAIPAIPAEPRPPPGTPSQEPTGLPPVADAGAGGRVDIPVPAAAEPVTTAPEPPVQQKGKPQSFMAMEDKGQGPQWVEVPDAKPIRVAGDDVTPGLFIRRVKTPSGKDGEYFIVEPRSGRAIGHGITRKEAVAMAVRNLAPANRAKVIQYMAEWETLNPPKPPAPTAKSSAAIPAPAVAPPAPVVAPVEPAVAPQPPAAQPEAAAEAAPGPAAAEPGPVNADEVRPELQQGVRVEFDNLDGKGKQPYVIVTREPFDLKNTLVGEVNLTIRNEATGEQVAVEAADISRVLPPREKVPLKQVAEAHQAQVEKTPPPAVVKNPALRAAARKVKGAKITVVKSENDIPDTDVRKSMQKQGAEGAQGVFVTEDGSIYVIEDAVPAGREEAVIAHEAVGHFGVRAELGDATPETLLDIYNKATGKMQDVIAKVAKDYGIDLSTEAGKREATEEALGALAETRSTDPTTWDKIVSGVRKILRKAGFVQEWSENDIQVLLYKAARRAGKEGAYADNISRIRQAYRAGETGTMLSRKPQADPFLNQEAQEMHGIVQDKRLTEGFPTKAEAPQREAAKRFYDKDPNAALNALSEGKVSPLTSEGSFIWQYTLDQEGKKAAQSGNPRYGARVMGLMLDYMEVGTAMGRAFHTRHDAMLSPRERNELFLNRAFLQPSSRFMETLGTMAVTEREKALESEFERSQQMRFELMMKLGIDIANLDEATLADPRKIAALVRYKQVKDASIGDKIYEYWRNSILSSLGTLLGANPLGNIANTGWDFSIQRSVEALLNLVFKNPEAAQFGELKYVWKHMLGSSRQLGWQNAVQAWSTEQPVLEGTRYDESGAAISDEYGGRIIRVPQRTLLFADELLKGITYRSQIISMAYREAVKDGITDEAAIEARIAAAIANPSQAMIEEATKTARELAFQGKLGTIGQMLLKGKHNKNIFIRNLSRYMFPFVTTPMNIVKQGMAKTPIGSLMMVSKAMHGEYKGNQKQLIRDLAEQVIATATTLALLGMVGGDDDEEPWITGTLAWNSPRGQRDQEQKYGPPQSVRIAGRWYSYARIEPFATSMATIVDLIKAMRSAPEKGIDAASYQAFNSVKQQLKDKTFLSSVGDIIRWADKDQGSKTWSENFAASWVPNMFRQGARAFDPYIRNVNDKGPVGKSILRKMLPIPLLQNPPKRDIWGVAIKKGEGPDWPPATDILYRMVVPVRTQLAITPNNIDRMLFNWNNKVSQKVGEKAWWPELPRMSYKKNGKTIEMTPDEYDKFIQYRGEFARKRLMAQYWRDGKAFNEPTKREVERVRDAFAAAGRHAKARLRRELKIQGEIQDE